MNCAKHETLYASIWLKQLNMLKNIAFLNETLHKSTLQKTIKRFRISYLEDISVNFLNRAINELLS